MFGIKIHPVAEDEEQYHGHDDSQCDAARIAQNLQGLLVEDTAQAHQE